MLHAALRGLWLSGQPRPIITTQTLVRAGVWAEYHAGVPYSRTGFLRVHAVAPLPQDCRWWLTGAGRADGLAEVSQRFKL